MSYVDQDTNTYIPAATDYNYVITYMAGDWEALRDYYGSGAAFNGNTDLRLQHQHRRRA